MHEFRKTDKLIITHRKNFYGVYLWLRFACVRFFFLFFMYHMFYAFRYPSTVYFVFLSIAYRQLHSGGESSMESSCRIEHLSEIIHMDHLGIDHLAYIISKIWLQGWLHTIRYAERKNLETSHQNTNKKKSKNQKTWPKWTLKICINCFNILCYVKKWTWLWGLINSLQIEQNKTCNF